MVISLFESMAYLFFLAIEAQYRGCGYGGQALELIERLYPDRQKVVDFERVDESAPNNAQRKKRRAFYMRHEYRETGKFISYLGVDYEILCMDEAFDFEMFQRMMRGFHIEGFHPEYFE